MWVFNVILFIFHHLQAAATFKEVQGEPSQNQPPVSSCLDNVRLEQLKSINATTCSTIPVSLNLAFLVFHPGVFWWWCLTWLTTYCKGNIYVE